MSRPFAATGGTLAGPILPSGSHMPENFTRIGNFGSPNVHWVEVFVDARDPNVVEANRFPR